MYLDTTNSKVQESRAPEKNMLISDNSSLSSINPTREFMLRHIGFDKKVVKAKCSKLIDDTGAVFTDFISQYLSLIHISEPTRPY